MNPHYAIRDTSSIYSPALVFYKDLIRKNITYAIEIAGDASRLRPHAKTHKTRELVRLEREAGITKHKCATLAEAEMLASAGATDILIAYNMVGPNCRRLAHLIRAYPQVRFAVTGDYHAALEKLSRVLAEEKQTVEVLLDLDVGQHRTGIAPGPEAAELYELLTRLPGLRPGGLHVYDGHNSQEGFLDRKEAVTNLLAPVLALRASLEANGLPVPRVVAGGTPTFPIFAKLDLPGLECSPGTCFLHDQGYGAKFVDMAGFTPAALLLTRIISKPLPTRLTLDLGYKAVASDPPAGKRLTLLDVPNYEAVLQNEEHLVIDTPQAANYQPGDELYAVPTHICPTCAMHKQAYIVEDGAVTGTWDIVGRDRVLSI
jgi:D-threonine aldolase